jgi:hypothetical protein
MAHEIYSMKNSKGKTRFEMLKMLIGCARSINQQTTRLKEFGRETPRKNCAGLELAVDVK